MSLLRNPHHKVRFKDEIYWDSTNTESLIRVLSPLSHFTDDGDLTDEGWSSGLSYAVIYNNDIMRYGEKIGNVSDLVEIKND